METWLFFMIGLVAGEEGEEGEGEEEGGEKRL